MLTFLFGKKRKKVVRSKKKVKSVPANIKKMCKKLNIKTTRKVNGKRVYKTVSQLKKEIKRKRAQKKSNNSKGKPKMSAKQARANGITRKKGVDRKMYCISKKRHLRSRPKWVLCKKSSFGNRKKMSFGLIEEFPSMEAWNSPQRTLFTIPLPFAGDGFDPGHVTMGAGETHSSWGGWHYTPNIQQNPYYPGQSNFWQTGSGNMFPSSEIQQYLIAIYLLAQYIAFSGIAITTRLLLQFLPNHPHQWRRRM